MQIELLRQRSDLEAIRTDWNRLPRPSTMQSPGWLIPWWDAYGGCDRELSVVAVRDRGKLIGLAPWYAEGSSRARRLRWLGDGRACSDHATILTDPESRAVTTRVLVDWVSERLEHDWRQIALESVDSDDVVVADLAAALAERGQPITRRPEPGSCCIELPATWEQYLAGVSKNHRKKCRRIEKQLLDTGRAETRILNTSSDCLAALEQLAALHGERRRTLGEAGAFDDARFRAFHAAAIAQLADHGDARLRLLSVDGETVAAEYVLQS
ncbi:MAG: GNAT family N-acetyltransferase, partial [Planctomycetota bacterium]